MLLPSEEETDKYSEGTKQRNPHHPSVALNPSLHSWNTLKHSGDSCRRQQLHKQYAVHLSNKSHPDTELALTHTDSVPSVSRPVSRRST
jgi:hypothetical protein